MARQLVCSTERGQFETLLRWKAEYIQSVHDRGEELNGQAQLASVAHARHLHPGKRCNNIMDVRKLLSDEQLKAINTPFQARLDQLYADMRAWERAFKFELYDRADAVPIHRGPLQPWKTVYVSSYSTQGFGAETYASAAAEQYADVARSRGVATEVARNSDAHTRKCFSFVVLVGAASPLDLTILEYSSGPSYKEQLRAMLKRGVNPRVFNPFLPHDLEHKLGMDYFGNDLKAKEG